jgi:CDP-glucose 4,6-dehydratase
VAEPVETFAANVMGTVNVLQAARRCPRLKAVLIVTTDKVYENDESGRAFREQDALGGRDPYAASKAAAELATRAMARTYFADVPVATARGGNVIGGGDFSEDRLIPDIVRSIEAGRPLRLRNPAATRPWQHVLDCLAGYFCFAQSLANGQTQRRALNFGPAAGEEVSVRDLADAMFDALGAPRSWVADEVPGAHEAKSLAIDSTAARAELGWRDRLASRSALDATAEWYRARSAGANMRDVTIGQIRGYEEMGN